jgi:hypothetical protein
MKGACFIRFRALFLGTAAVLLAGCASTNGQPRMHEASIAPSQLKPGDTAIVKVKVDDRYGIVKKVEGVVAEDGTIKFDLKDDGMPPDEAAGDGIWTIKVKVPFNAPPGDFHFTVYGYDETGNRILILDEMDETAPLSTSFELNIEYPKQEQ